MVLIQKGANLLWYRRALQVNVRNTLSLLADVLETTVQSVRSVWTAASTLGRMDCTVTLKRCSAWQYFVVRFGHNPGSARVAGLPHPVLGVLHGFTRRGS